MRERERECVCVRVRWEIQLFQMQAAQKMGQLKCPCMDPEMGQEWVRLKVRNTVKKTARKRVRPKEELH